MDQLAVHKAISKIENLIVHAAKLLAELKAKVEPGANIAKTKKRKKPTQADLVKGHTIKLIKRGVV